jgi:hypothetical protein
MTSFCLRVIKTFDVFILGNMYLLLGVFASKMFKKYLVKPYDKDKSKLDNLLQLILEIGLLMVAVYIIRSLVIYLTRSKFNILDGICGFRPRNVLELNGGVILAFSFLMYVKEPIRNKIDNLLD